LWFRCGGVVSVCRLKHYSAEALSLFNAKHVSDVIHPSSRACDLFVELFHGLYCSGSMCVGVTLWFGCGGMVSVCRLRH